jgi:hypothetical protein
VAMKRAANLSPRYGVIAIAFVAALIFSSVPARAAAWNGIEPLKTRRDEVVKLLGAPIGESPDGVMRFNVMGGSVQVSFVNDKFVTAKKLRTRGHRPGNRLAARALFGHPGIVETIEQSCVHP